MPVSTINEHYLVRNDRQTKDEANDSNRYENLTIKIAIVRLTSIGNITNMTL